MKLVRTSRAIVVMALVAQHLSFAQSQLDVVYLRSGGKIIGHIIQRSDSQSVRIQLQSGDFIIVSSDKIKKIESRTLKPLEGPIAAEGRTISYVTLLPSERSIARDTTWKISSAAGVLASNCTLDSLRGTMLFVTSRQPGLRQHIEAFGLFVPTTELQLAKARFADSIDVVSIKELRLVKESHFWAYAGLGLFAGALVGAVIGAESYEPAKGLTLIDFGPELPALIGGAIGLVSGFFAGGVLGAVLGADIVFEMPVNDVAASMGRIQKIFQQQD